MAPLCHRSTRAIARLKDERVQAALEQMRGRCQSLRAGPNDDDGTHTNLQVLMIFDMTSLPYVSTLVNMWGRMVA